MNQKVPVLLPLILTVVLIVVLFFFFNLSIKHFGLKAHHLVQQEIIAAYADLQAGKIPDTNSLRKYEQIIKADSALLHHYEMIQIHVLQAAE
jgi:hypothetical protein